MKKSRHKFYIAFLLIIPVLFLLNHWTIEWTMTGPETINLEYGQRFEDPGVQATLYASVFPFYKHAVPVTVTSDVNLDKLGKYSIEYHVKTRVASDSKTRVVNILDTTAPTITLVENPQTYTLPNHPYQEEGYHANDNYDGNLTDAVIHEEKDGKVIYRVTDSSGNATEVERDIRYDDRTAPVLSIGEGTIYLTEGDTFDDSYSAEDDVLGDVTARVEVDGTVDTNTPGSYTLTYRVSDDFKNESTAERTVIVQSKPKPTPPSSASNTEKIAYLTFDDGPSAYTAQLLDILAKYQAKATFFVTGADANYAPLIKRAYEEGHGIGAHTFTHDYASIYSNDDAFWEDNQRIARLIEDETGQWPTLLRFAGGSSNTVSKHYNSGIMTRLAGEASAHGYRYFDWNVSSGDAGETTDASVVAANIISGIQNHSTPMILCHDVKAYTIEAMEPVLQWCRDNGYQLKAITSDTPEIHHPIAN